VGFYGGETGEEVEKDWDNLRDYYGTSVKYLKKLLRANRLPLGCQLRHRHAAFYYFIIFPISVSRRRQTQLAALLVYFWCFTAMTRL
jgi:hypothetical protein